MNSDIIQDARFGNRISEDAAEDFLYPLSVSYLSHGQPPPSATRVEGCELPEPYRSLLAHESDMTPTLEDFHGDRIALQVLDFRRAEQSLWRLVVLRLQETKRPVEFGAIVIHLGAFPQHAQERILEGRLPLGSIMAANRVERISQPEAFFHIRADRMIAESLGTRVGFWLYGRRNRLTTPSGQTLADIVEILPP